MTSPGPVTSVPAGIGSSGGSSGPLAPLSPGGPYSGQFFVPASAGVTSTSAALGFGTLRLTPVYLPNLNVQAVGGECTVVGSAGTTMLPAIYADNGQGAPGALLSALPQAISGLSATVQVPALGSVLDIPAGWYWLGGVVQGTGTQPTIRTTSSLNLQGLFLPNATANGTSSGMSAVSLVGVTGALPASLAQTIMASAGSAPRLVFQLA